tara:strand:- start:2880 stop:2996 length:117 start_codon:yes stop_codon:yes gene_type:complete
MAKAYQVHCFLTDPYPNAPAAKQEVEKTKDNILSPKQY